jgi:TIR domain
LTQRYDLVHFDGHGAYLPHSQVGALRFEKPDDGAGQSKTDLVAAEQLGSLLAKPLRQFDAFLSQNHNDSARVEALARTLTEMQGLRVWLDKWECALGIKNSRFTIVVGSAAALKSKWVRREIDKQTTTPSPKSPSPAVTPPPPRNGRPSAMNFCKNPNATPADAADYPRRC